jgi:hypothetical protein
MYGRCLIEFGIDFTGDARGASTVSRGQVPLLQVGGRHIGGILYAEPRDNYAAMRDGPIQGETKTAFDSDCMLDSLKSKSPTASMRPTFPMDRFRV